jgi:hypothetical protein
MHPSFSSTNQNKYNKDEHSLGLVSIITHNVYQTITFIMNGNYMNGLNQWSLASSN